MNKRYQHYTPGELQVRAREDGGESRTIEGYCILFNSRSLPMVGDADSTIYEVIDPSAVSRSLLDDSDIKMTLYHMFSRLLARSFHGEGTLSYAIDEKGVRFKFEAPNTADGDTALELVRRRDLRGCSFMFYSKYDEDVEREVLTENNKTVIVYRVKKIRQIFDFTLTESPAYPETSVKARGLSFFSEEEKQQREAKQAERKRNADYLAEVRASAKYDKF